MDGQRLCDGDTLGGELDVLVFAVGGLVFPSGELVRVTVVVLGNAGGQSGLAEPELGRVALIDSYYLALGYTDDGSLSASTL